jgi:DNA-binding response OmpR family regulator
LASALRSSAHILIVEDDGAFARLMRGMLETATTKVEWCSDGVSAIETAHRLSPDLVLLDVNIPERDGFDVCRTIRNTEAPDRRSTIVMLTGRNDVASKLLAFSVGADDYLVKPVDVRELRTRVERWIQMRALHEDLVLRRRREAIQEVVTTICHQVNNPLAVALMAVDLVLGRATVPGESVRDLETARDHLLRIGDVLQSLQAMEDRTVPYVGEERMLDITPPDVTTTG